MRGTLRWYWLDGNGSYDAIDCKSASSARALSAALVAASERELHHFQYLFVEDDYSESTVEWFADEVLRISA
jgi:hypothetical protein